MSIAVECKLRETISQHFGRREKKEHCRPALLISAITKTVLFTQPIALQVENSTPPSVDINSDRSINRVFFGGGGALGGVRNFFSGVFQRSTGLSFDLGLL